MSLITSFSQLKNFGLAISAVVSCVFGMNTLATAQSITSDGTLPNPTQVTERGNVAEITGGTTRGNNLFHSFQDFSVGTGNEAFFNNADNIANILGRVTGGNLSNIDGLLRANGSANLFLLNPAGIVFGEGARLNLGGSFFGSTADSIVFEEGEFNATNPDNTPLLTINAPIGFNFRTEPADIIVKGNGNGQRMLESEAIDTQDALRVNPEATIGLVGGNLIFEDAVLKTAGGRIELGSVAGGRVDLLPVGNRSSLDYSGINNFQDITLSGRTNIDASGLGAGNIQMQGRNITLSGVSAVEANILGDRPGGGIAIFADEAIEISGMENELSLVSAFGSSVFPSGNADGGDINIETGTLTIGDRAAIGTTTFGRGNAGNITINTRDSISLESQGNTAEIRAGVTGDAVGDGGNIELNTGSLTLNDNAFVNAETLGEGNGGNIKVNAREAIEIVGNDADSTLNTGINASSGSASNGNGGNIELNTGSLILNNGASIVTVGQDLSKGGEVTINATENVSFTNNSSIFTSAGEGGAIAINAKNLSLIAGGSIIGGIAPDSGFAEARAGDITISLSEDLTIDGLGNDGLTYINNPSFGTGNPGEIEIAARNVTFKNGGNISTTSNFDNVSIGNITLNATGNILFDGIKYPVRSGISNFLLSDVGGSIGEINISANNLTLTNGGGIGSQVAGVADSGNINLNIVDSIVIDGFDDVSFSDGSTVLGSSVFSNVVAGGTGNAGNINIETGNLALSRNGNIEALIQGRGSGGNIEIDAEQITLSEQGNKTISPSTISTGTIGESQANGGKITIDTNSLYIRDGSDIESSVTGVGNGGNIEINARDLVLVEGTGILFSREENRDVEIPSSIEADVLLEGNGNGGSIEIDTGRLIVDNNALISADVLRNSTGNGGSIAIRASDSIEVLGNGTIQASVFPDSSGTGGNLTIESKDIILNSGTISATTQSGQGANIDLTAKDILQLVENSTISAVAFNEANGGNININSDIIVAFPNRNNDIIASAAAGEGGNINITAEALFGLEERPQNPFTNDIDASSEFGLDGGVTISNPDVDIIRGATELPINLITTEQTIAEVCTSNATTARSTLIVNGRGGIMPEPSAVLNSEEIIAGDRSAEVRRGVPMSITTAKGNIIPARGVIERDGKIELTAEITALRQRDFSQTACKNRT